jgi:uncharacterized protein
MVQLVELDEQQLHQRDLEELLSGAVGAGRPRMLVIQPSPWCNIDCDYCYLRDRTNRATMGDAIVAAIAERIVAEIDPATATLVVWHGGEPAAVPLGWYRAAMARLSPAKRGLPLRYSLQTNGIGLDDEWVAFLRDTGTEVGLSLDGPQDLHDRHRRTRAGRPTWHLAMAALARLRRGGIEPGIITVLTADAVDRADDLLDFYAANGIRRLSFSVEEREGANAASSLDGPGWPPRMERFLAQFLRGVVSRGLPIHVREAERILGTLATDTAAGNDQVEPLAIVTVDHRGGLYSFSPEFSEHAAGDWAHLRLGDVRDQTLAGIAAGPALRRLTAEIGVGLAACAAACPYWRVCGGGAPVNRLAETGSLATAETQFCRLTVQATVRALHRVLPVPGAPAIDRAPPPAAPGGMTA